MDPGILPSQVEQRDRDPGVSIALTGTGAGFRIHGIKDSSKAHSSILTLGVRTIRLKFDVRNRTRVKAVTGYALPTLYCGKERAQIDAGIHSGIALKIAHGSGQHRRRSDLIARRVMMKCDRQLYETLQECLVSCRTGPPNVFEDFMSFEKFTLVKQPNPRG
jgi:hypothetical protein